MVSSGFEIIMLCGCEGLTHRQVADGCKSHPVTYSTDGTGLCNRQTAFRQS